MRRIRFLSVLHGIARMGGVNPAEGDYTDAYVWGLAEFVNMRVREGWEWIFWPEWTVSEERTPVDDVVSLEQSGETEIGEVFGVSKNDSDSNENTQWISWKRTSGGIYVPDAPSTVWVRFRLRPPEFTGVEYVGTTAYVTGDVVYVVSAGECYKALQGSTGQNPVTESSYWELVEFPYVLGNFVKRAALADSLREEDEDDVRPARMEGRAYEDLYRAVDVVEEQQGYAGTVEVAA